MNITTSNGHLNLQTLIWRILTLVYPVQSCS